MKKSLLEVSKLTFTCWVISDLLRRKVASTLCFRSAGFLSLKASSGSLYMSSKKERLIISHLSWRVFLHVWHILMNFSAFCQHNNVEPFEIVPKLEWEFPFYDPKNNIFLFVCSTVLHKETLLGWFPLHTNAGMRIRSRRRRSQSLFLWKETFLRNLPKIHTIYLNAFFESLLSAIEQ